MQITITVPDKICREADSRGLPVVDFVETLISKGMETAEERVVVSSAIERIRALRSSSSASKVPASQQHR